MSRSSSKRLSNYELLRVISMVIIIYHHYAWNTYWYPTTDEPTPRSQQLLISLLATGARPGVNLFVIISGYFLCGRAASVKTVTRIWLVVVMYSWSWLIIGLSTKMMPFNLRGMVGIIFPVITSTYWFCSAFIGLMFLTPALGKIPDIVSHQSYVSMLTVMFISICIHRYSLQVAYSSLFWFVFLFLVGAYLKKYEYFYSTIKTRTLFYVNIFLWLLNAFLITFFSMKEFKFVQNRGAHFLLTVEASPMALFVSVAIFMFVGRLEFWSPLINTLGSLMFGVYLCHEHPLIRNYLWDNFVRGPSRTGPGKTLEFYLYSLAAPMGVLLVCSVIERVRQIALGRLEDYIVDRIARIILNIGDYLSPKLEIKQSFDFDTENVDQ